MQVKGKDSMSPRFPGITWTLIPGAWDRIIALVCSSASIFVAVMTTSLWTPVYQQFVYRGDF